VPTSFFYLQNSAQKAKFKIQKICDFESFHSPKVREKIVKMLDFYIWFSVCSQKYRRMIKALHKLLIENWPNIRRDDNLTGRELFHKALITSVVTQCKSLLSGLTLYKTLRRNW
jgi:hypothetical protein